MSFSPRMKRFSRLVVTIFLFCAFGWMLKGIFGPIFGQSKQTQKPKIKYVIFDLGYVLLNPNKLTQYANVGLGSILQYTLTGHNPAKLHDKMEDIAAQVCPIEDETINARTHDGSRPLSQLFRDWLSGKHSSEDSLIRVATFIEMHPELFCNKAEKKALLSIFSFAFTPKLLSKVLVPVKSGIKFVQECKDSGLEVLILSNMDSETYDWLEARYPELFCLFEQKNIFVSGDLGLIKPDPQIYQALLHERGLDPQECVFFDDQQENIDAARACGINAFLCPQKKKLLGQAPDINHLREQLITLLAHQEQQDIKKATA